MNTTKMTTKRIYNCPEILCIELDNKISLALESNPPAGPDEGVLFTPKFISPDPFKVMQG